MIDVQNVGFSYRAAQDVLIDISFDLEEGHCLALLGNNGAGKSTLLKCLNRILEPNAGVVAVSGRNVRNMKRGEIAKNLAYVAQHNEGGQLTVFDSVLLGRKPYIKMDPTAEDERIAWDAIHRMELDAFALRYVDELSGGELQKVVLARALTQQPRVLLLDEPTSNLDLHNQHEVMRTVREIADKDGILVIVVIHDLNLAVRYCDRFLFIRDGSIFEYGDSSVITDDVITQVYRIPVRVLEIDGQKFVIVQ
ncbi:MAG: ABC transporter ATP-binding protein [Oscillospiraceae bacterium]|nr:ABC transporter ATP-binding protein [Oscillospiraceae bacterium]